MIALWLIAAHMAGDYLLQTRWQAARKLDEPWVRLRHVTTYTAAFVPVVLLAHGASWLAWGRVVFLVALFVLHFATDSRRFHSTLGDAVVWRLGPSQRTERRAGFPLGPSPWTPLPILIDQSLHLVQLAVLGSLFL